MQFIHYNTENFLMQDNLMIFSKKFDSIININYFLIILFIIILYIAYIVHSKFKSKINIKLEEYDEVINKLNSKITVHENNLKKIRDNFREIQNNNEISLKYKNILSKVIKSREIFIKSHKILNEINELNELTIEVNKNWKGNIYFCVPYIGLLDIHGGNSNSWGKDNNFLKNQRNSWLDKLKQFKIKHKLSSIDLDINTSLVNNNDCINQYYLIRNIELAKLEYLRNIQELDRFHLDNRHFYST